MDLGTPPSDPFGGLTARERKCAQELAILKMVYDLAEFESVEPRERPDFALVVGGTDRAFGVEVTQMFVDESRARLQLIHDYVHRLWSGGGHLHKKDKAILQSVRVRIDDKDGNLKAENVPAVLTKEPGMESFRSALRDLIMLKSAKTYDCRGLRHCNLVILDWFNLAFTAHEYWTNRFFDAGVRQALRECPFREVFLILNNTASDPSAEVADQARLPDRRVIPLQQLMALERFFVTARMINDTCEPDLDGVALTRLTADHVSRVQGYGRAVEWNGRPFLSYRANFVEMTERGMNVIDHAELDLTPASPLHITDGLTADGAERVTKAVDSRVFGFGYARPALGTFELASGLPRDVS